MERGKTHGRTADEILDAPRVRKLQLELETSINQWCVTMHALGMDRETRDAIVQSVVRELARAVKPFQVRLPKGVKIPAGNGSPKRPRLGRGEGYSRTARTK